MSSATSTARLEARISPELHAILKRAAEIRGRSLTDFVVSAAQEAAQRAIEQGEVVRLSLADSERFAQALLSPPNPSPALERAFARRSKLLRPTSKAQVKTLALTPHAAETVVCPWFPSFCSRTTWPPERPPSGWGVTPVGSVGIIAKSHVAGMIDLAEAERALRELQETSSLFVSRAIVEGAIRALRGR